METEKIMRTSIFGGFKREDVLSYVEELKNEIETLKTSVNEKEDSVSQLNSKVVELTKECEEIATLKADIEAKADTISTITSENSELKQQVAKLTAVAKEYDEARLSIEQNNKSIKAAEARLGAAFVDARKYSDEIVSAANDKANEASKNIATDITRQAGEITKLSTEVDRISNVFTKSIDELHANIAILAQRMAAAAKNLNNRQDAVFEPDFSFKIDSAKDVSSVIETNDGSGLTYIQYPPKTEFNEDLNIKPDSVFGFDGSKEG